VVSCFLLRGVSAHVHPVRPFFCCSLPFNTPPSHFGAIGSGEPGPRGFAGPRMAAAVNKKKKLDAAYICCACCGMTGSAMPQIVVRSLSAHQAVVWQCGHGDWSGATCRARRRGWPKSTAYHSRCQAYPLKQYKAPLRYRTKHWRPTIFGPALLGQSRQGLWALGCH
jgi:hypothetical protein